MLETWIEKIRSNDANKVTDLYHENGLLLGTFSSIERNGRKLIHDYFKSLLTSQVNIEIITKHEYKAESIATSSGLYNFLLNDEKIKARFSFVFLKTKNKWQILSHHSSVLPQKNKSN